MKKIILNSEKNKTREIIKSAMMDISLCESFENLFNNHNKQLELLKNLNINVDFNEKKFLLNQIKSKIQNYKSQDVKKDIHTKNQLISLNDIILKLLNSELKCYYCKCNIFLFFETVRFKKQWTLDRLNNLDEHTNNNTIISCLECNLQRRRKNSEKFLFTKQLETQQLTIKKIQ
tara:strand:+ start:2167 stop:2691 length:525 start_codon:yes stop_codon:yes gene_type:complete